VQHSELLSKLYARIGVAIPFVYRCGAGVSGSRTSSGAAPSSGSVQHPPPGTVVRILPVYIRPEHVRDVVRRCPNHASEAVNMGGRTGGNKLVLTRCELFRLFEADSVRV
jgi:P53 DNA-binding domain